MDDAPGPSRPGKADPPRRPPAGRPNAPATPEATGGPEVEPRRAVEAAWIVFLVAVALVLAGCVVVTLVASSRAPVGAPG